MPSPPSQLPFPAAAFEDLHPDLDPDLDGYRFEGTDFGCAQADGLSFLECTLVGCRLDEAALASSRWSDCSWERVHGVGFSLAEATLVDTRITHSRLAAVSAWGSHWRDVTVQDCKIDWLNLRGATLRDVAFVDCVVVELDVQEATLERVSFVGCTLVEPQFRRGRYAGLDLSGAELRGPRGVAALRGATLRRPQLMDVAEHLAAELGIAVVD